MLFIPDKCYSFSLFIKILSARKNDFTFKVNLPFVFGSNKGMEVMFSTLLIVRNDSWAANQYIRMISEGSREDWRNDAENSAFTF